jgi:hypothetical protein
LQDFVEELIRVVIYKDWCGRRGVSGDAGDAVLGGEEGV